MADVTAVSKVFRDRLTRRELLLPPPEVVTGLLPPVELTLILLSNKETKGSPELETEITCVIVGLFDTTDEVVVVLILCESIVDDDGDLESRFLSIIFGSINDWGWCGSTVSSVTSFSETGTGSDELIIEVASVIV